MSSTNIDYVDTYFEVPSLTRIHGEPTYASLKIVKDELKSNASSVTSDLGGGNHGHLGLILSPADYQTISAVPYVRPVHPGPLVLQPGITQHEATRLTNDHKKAIKVFRETVDVEKALVKQLVAAVDSTYIKSLRNVTSNSITVPLHDVLDYLFTRYGQVEPDLLEETTEKVQWMDYSLSDPLITIFTKIEELEQLAIAANNPFTDSQKVQLGLAIIKRTHDFEKGLEKWYDRPTIQHTWVHFKTHFENAHTLLRKLRGKEMRNTAYHQANSLATQMRSEIRLVEENVINACNELRTYQNETDENEPPLTHTANAVTGDPTQLAILQLLKGLTEELTSQRTTNNRRNNNNSKKSYYCWTHGRCNHKGTDCRNKAAGHKDDAMINNRMDGSNKGCRYAPST